MVHAYPTPWLREKIQCEGGYFAPVAPGFAVCETASAYSPRNPAESILYGMVAGQLETFQEIQHRRDRCVPRFVERELRSFLDCGILARGFLRVHCMPAARTDLYLIHVNAAGFAHRAAAGGWPTLPPYLVDRVFPEVPVRQWVLSLPFALRYRLAYNSSLVRDVLQVFVRAVFASIRRHAGITTSNHQARCGAVSFVQRFGDALNLNVHFHTMVLDGIYVADTGCMISPDSDDCAINCAEGPLHIDCLKATSSIHVLHVPATAAEHEYWEVTPELKESGVAVGNLLDANKFGTVTCASVSRDSSICHFLSALTSIGRLAAERVLVSISAMPSRRVVRWCCPDNRMTGVGRF